MSKKIPHRSLSSNEESNQSSFLYVPSDLFNDFSLSLEEERILAIIRSYEGSCYWSLDRFAKYCRCSVRQTLRAIQKLEKSGRIQKKNRGSLSNLYSEIPLTCQPVMMTNCHDDKLSQLTCQTVTINMTDCHNQHDSLSHYTDKDNTTYKDNYNTSIVADAPLPTESLLKDSLIDLELVKEPLETLEEPESSGATHPPRDSAPPLPKKKKTPSRNTSFPSPEFWASVKPNLLSWMRDHGAEGTDKELSGWIDERLEKLEGAALSKNLKFAAWDRTFMTWYRHLIPDKYKRGFDWFVRNAVDQPRFLEVWKKKKDLEAFGYSDEAIEGYRKTLLNFDEDSPWGGSKIKQFRKTVQKGA